LSLEPCKISDLRCQALLSWYHKHGRSLPWRDSSDPYHIWISEIMLQQTQVKTVLPRYAAWFEQFPSIASLSQAHLDAVLKAWEGLGYYRRARFIHQAAQQMMNQQAIGQQKVDQQKTDQQTINQQDCIFPTDFNAIMALPGIGRSTAGAIASFCFAAATPVLDANVKRVLKRWHNIPQANDKTLWPLAQQAIDASAATDIWNQAMMELGATLCSAKTADCEHCPVKTSCASAFQVDFHNEQVKKTIVRNAFWRVNLHLDAQKGIWLSQRPAAGIWAGLWTPPITELDQQPQGEPDHIHLLSHRRLHLYAQVQSNSPTGDGIWVNTFDNHALPTGIHRLLSTFKPSIHQFQHLLQYATLGT